MVCLLLSLGDPSTLLVGLRLATLLISRSTICCDCVELAFRLCSELRIRDLLWCDRASESCAEEAFLLDEEPDEAPDAYSLDLEEILTRSPLETRSLPDRDRELRFECPLLDSSALEDPERDLWELKGDAEDRSGEFAGLVLLDGSLLLALGDATRSSSKLPNLTSRPSSTAPLAFARDDLVGAYSRFRLSLRDIFSNTTLLPPIHTSTRVHLLLSLPQLH